MNESIEAVMSRCSRMIEGSSCIRVGDEAVAYIRNRASAAERVKGHGPSEEKATEEKEGAGRQVLSPIEPKEAPGPPDHQPTDCTVDAAKQWLHRHLDGYAVARDVREAAEQAGYRWRDVERAKWQLGVQSVKVGGRWYWERR